MFAGPPRGRRVPTRRRRIGIDNRQRKAIPVGARLPRIAVDKIVNQQIRHIQEANFLAVVVQRIAERAGDVDPAAVARCKRRRILHHHNLRPRGQINVSKSEIHAGGEMNPIKIDQARARIGQLDKFIFIPTQRS